jgi:hypothetical protein
MRFLANELKASSKTNKNSEPSPETRHKNMKTNHDEIGYLLKWTRKEESIRAISETLKPPGGIDDVHILSGSLGTIVSIPFRNPFISDGFFKGIISILSPYMII